MRFDLDGPMSNALSSPTLSSIAFSVRCGPPGLQHLLQLPRIMSFTERTRHTLSVLKQPISVAVSWVEHELGLIEGLRQMQKRSS